MSNKYVVDASVAIKMLVEEPLTDRAEDLFALLASDSKARLIAPDLLYTECANVLWKHTIRQMVTERDARTKLDQLSRIAFDIVPTRSLLPEAMGFACRLRVSVYDACYLAASRLARAPLITSDEKLVSALRGQWGDVISLRDFRS